MEQEPEAIGGYLPLERVYSYEPMPASLTPEEQKDVYKRQAYVRSKGKKVISWNPGWHYKPRG